MAISKTFLGYHNGCGGRVYRESMNNSLMSHSYCDACFSDTAKGGFDPSGDVVSDLSAMVAAHPTGDLPLVDTEYRMAYQNLINRAQGNTNFLDTIMTVFSFPQTIDGYLNGVDEVYNTLSFQQTQAQADAGDAIAALASAGAQIASADGTIGAPDTTQKITTYYFDPRASLDGLVDSSSGVWDWSGSEPVSGGAMSFTTADTSVDSVMVSADYTVAHGVNDVFVLLASPKYPDTATGTRSDDWTRGSNMVQFQVSVNGGTGYTNSKWIDSTITHPYIDYKEARVSMATAGSVFKWKLTMAKENYPRGFLGLTAKLKYIPSNNYTDYLYTIYV